jgi:mono/diheme cytochrome c family protein
MREIALFTALALGFAVSGCKRGAGSASPQAEADELYRLNCARCHGMNGAGPGFAVPPGGGPTPARNFEDPDFQSGRSDADLRRAIVEGKGSMPPFGKMFDDRELDLLVRKVRSFK